jgi:uncharacterized protein with beta-barrel porin domain
MARAVAYHTRAAFGRLGSILPALLLTGLLLLSFPPAADAQNWNGSVSNLWSNASNWTPNTVPNSSAASATITNTTNNPVLIDIAPTIGNLTVGSVNSVNLNNAGSLTVAGGAGAGSLGIAGTLTIGSTGSFTDLILAGAAGSTITLSGGGTLALSNSPNNRVFSTTGDTLVNSAGNTIRGAGQLGINNAGFGFTLNNAGIINANQSGGILQVAPTNTVTNTNLMEATNGGTLALIGAFTNTGGTIQATGAGSFVNFSGSTITGGTLTTQSGGAIGNIGTATLNGVTISNGSTVTGVNNSSTTLQNTITINPTATLALSSTGSLTDLHISGTVELAGGGTLALSNSPNNRIFATGTDTLINDAGNTIQGAGQLGISNAGFAFTLNNAGIINANQSGGTLRVAPTNTVTNTNLMEATNGGTLALIGAFTNTGGTIKAMGAGSFVDFSGSTITGGTLTTQSGGAIGNNGTATLNGVTISSGSTVTALNASSTTLQNTITINPTATLALSSTGSFTDLHISGTVHLAGGGTLALSNSPNNRIFATGADTLINDAGNTIQGAGQFGINNAGFGFTLTNNGTILANQSNALNIAPSGNTTNNGTFQANSGSTLFMNGTLTNYAPGTSTLTGGTYNAFSGTIQLSQANTGTGAVIATNAATILLDGASANIADGGGNDILQGFLKTNGAAGNFTIQNGRNLTSAASSNFTNAGAMTIGASSTFTVGGSQNYVQSGGSTFLTASSSTLAANSVNLNGGTLSGFGTVQGNLSNNGGVLQPGASGVATGILTVQGNLSFTAASTYMIQVSPANAARTNVSGTATFGGATVNAFFLPGSYVNKQYTIVKALGGVSGTFNPAVISNMANIQSTLTYDANNAFLNIQLAFVPPPSGTLNVNQQNVANALTNFFNSTGSIPAAFAALGPGGLTQASGEAATASQQTTFDAMNLFLGLLTDPFVAGRGDGATGGAGATPFAEENASANAYAASGKPRTESERDAYSAIYRKTPVSADPFAQRWSVWAAGYGGSQTTDGNAALGSNTATSRVYGTAVGADYRFSPFTLAGFALVGGGTNFSIANALGSGRSDLFQAGAFIRHTAGPAYISAALAYGWQDITTDRTFAGVDQLRAQFNANAFSGRVEGGYRFVTPWMAMGITPYAAAQFTTFDLPAYVEQAVSGANTFALAYGAKSVTASRSELGLRTDKSWAMMDSIFTLRGRFAWAHNFNTDRNIGATFQTLPGASFVVNGAAQASDSALTTASAEIKWMNGWSAAATFEGEFSEVTRSYAGKGVVRYLW